MSEVLNHLSTFFVRATFHEAALKLGFLEDDDVANSALAEASEDFAKKYPENSQKVQQLTVRGVEQHLEAMGKSLSAFGLDHLYSETDDEFRRKKDIIDALDAPIPEECLNCRPRLNAAFTCIMQHILEGKSGAFFIDGPGGPGKTFLYNTLYAEVRLMNKIVLPTAASGFAAANIPSGRTAHSRFKIPIDNEGSLACDVPKQSSLAALTRKATLIIWDEASMAKKQNLESLDLLLQDVCENKTMFGGKIVVFGGDFRQLLPFVPQKTMKEAVETSIVTSYLWQDFIKFKLTVNIRAQEDQTCSAFLLALGNGELQTAESGYIQLPRQVAHFIESDTDLINDLTQTTFPEINQGSFGSDVFTKGAILTPLNDEVDVINAYMIEKFPGESIIYKSFDIMLNDTCNVYPTEFINKLCPGGMSPHELVLKPDCPVILLRNLLPSSAPPTFTGENYDYWCIKMRLFLKASALWEIVEIGFVRKQGVSYTEAQLKKISDDEMKDARALSHIINCVSDTIFPKIMRASSTKEAWSLLEEEFHGDEKIRNTRLNTLRSQYDNMKMKENEEYKRLHF
ncbi:uncharacterized protein LOC110727275 [Chenopodium quinoa]|uniref:uncharacterized protein LOC110727275 n=1 Tax=Chenopodium quinoa TaxID=63459 RepID=UPI000B77A464|nr:uncharacterized protein LOC110727275 [Chenopodium quinoa]